jgi:hypothetical protein
VQLVQVPPQSVESITLGAVFVAAQRLEERAHLGNPIPNGPAIAVLHPLPIRSSCLHQAPRLSSLRTRK